ncbi:MAG: GHKL domain-containing protein [Aureispira sp.]|nr:GHKL domain-containing protein [Aureispira sp.]
MKSKAKYSILGHLIFWLVFASIPFYANASVFGWAMGLIRTLPPFLFVMGLAYLNIFVIVPKLFRFNRAKKLSLSPLLIYFPIIVLAGTIVYGFLFYINHWSETQIILNFGFYKTDGTVLAESTNFKHLPILFTASVVTLMLFASSLYALAFEFLYRERKEAALQKESLQNELKFLRAQINPHFLFNAMNNLYAIVQLRPQEAGDFVLKLSDMLRYVTYECKEEKVSLSKEIEYLQNYVFFQQQRDLDFKNITLEIDVDNARNLEIGPMLLIPFIENCFKHSYTEDVENRWINIKLEATAEKLLFQTQNNIPPEGGDTVDAQDQYMGIGAANIQRRLELLYPDQYHLNIQTNNNTYSVELQINFHYA